MASGSYYPKLIIIQDELLGAAIKIGVQPEEWKLLPHPFTCVVNKVKHYETYFTDMGNIRSLNSVILMI